jgi:predicted AAA+ superfamily ATPase
MGMFSEQGYRTLHLRFFFTSFPSSRIFPSFPSSGLSIMPLPTRPAPVGRINYYHLGPMTFSEFVPAVEPELAKDSW